VPRAHELKEDPAPFEAVWARLKMHEVRVDDRGYQVGDHALLREHEGGGRHTGRWVKVEITHVTPGGTYGLPDKLCCWTFLEMRRGEGGRLR
jgi:hypothetical protein